MGKQASGVAIESIMSQEVVVFLMSSDKVPPNSITYPYAYCSIM